MRAAVISDIHGNLPALEVVLAAIDAQSPDAVWCLGDLVGYGPWPNEVTALVRERADVCLVGNHDLVALGSAGVGVEEFNPEAAEAALWTRGELDADTRAFLESLEPRASGDGAGLYHASPRDPVWEYVLSAEAAAGAFEAVPDNLILVGHSHVALEFTLEGDLLSGGVVRGGGELELVARHLLNPGSVGQPRDGDPRPCYVIQEPSQLTFRRVDYDPGVTANKIYNIPELDDFLGDRIKQGR
jgi:diadenosine tetraphosphatase ApaH/serine/threonine PP2A family protein phosphatase